MKTALATQNNEVQTSAFPNEPVLSYFGAVARWMGFISTREILDAFALQVHEEGEGCERRKIGEICRDLGYMSQEQVDEVVAFLDAQRAAS